MEVMQQVGGGSRGALAARRDFVGAAPARIRRCQRWRDAAGGRRMECVERLPLGPQQTLHLVRMGESGIAGGVIASGCTLLKSFGRRSKRRLQR